MFRDVAIKLMVIAAILAVIGCAVYVFVDVAEKCVCGLDRGISDLGKFPF